MARVTGARCRLCRRESMKLFLKGDRCYSSKCAMERRQNPPGMHGGDRRRRKVGAYAMQLREKQRLKRLFGLFESAFVKLLRKAESQAGNSGENFLRLLESRLDNVVLRLGIATSHSAARMLIVHGHVRVNGRKVDIPSFLVKAGDEISVPNPSMSERIQASMKAARDRGSVPSWVEITPDEVKGTVKVLPNKEDISLPVDEGLVVTFYSK